MIKQKQKDISHKKQSSMNKTWSEYVKRKLSDYTKCVKKSKENWEILECLLC